MSRHSPLCDLHEAEVRAQAARTSHAEADARPGAAVGEMSVPLEVEYLFIGESPDEVCEVVAAFGVVELEYAAIRKGAGLMDCPQRATLRVTGGDRRDFLGRLLTQELKGLAVGQSAESFWLDRKGRIVADLLLVETGEEILIDVDIHSAAAVVESLGEFVFVEEVEIEDVSETQHRLELQGAKAGEVLSQFGAEGEGLGEPLGSGGLMIGGVEVFWVRRDSCGEPGFGLFVPTAGAEQVWVALTGAGAKPVGWFAYNTARIEAGTPIFNVDFGRNNLPHESGLLKQRVSFTKGCYLGQEIVARLENLGKPKQVLGGVRMKGDDLPVAGAVVYGEGEKGAIGVVTSSTLSPMGGAVPVGLAMLKRAHSEPGTAVMIDAEGGLAEGEVCALPFWKGTNG